jgi:hypothetical protein
MFFTSCLAWAQDNIYFTDGSSKTCKVLEISDYEILAEVQGETLSFVKTNVLLIEFKNGTVDVYNIPQDNLIYNPIIEQKTKKKPEQKEFLKSNFASLNTLALCNADLSVFFEHLLPGRSVGLGVMGAYNFNPRVSVSNLFIAPLENAKKKYDLGLFANIYTGGFETKTTSVYFGILIKYMNFSYTKVTEVRTTIGSSTSLSLKRSNESANQLATIFTFGTHSNLTKNFFIKTIFGIGGFNLRGDYRQQYNYYLNGGSNRSNNQNYYNRKFLLKLYIGVNTGFTF